MATTLPLRWPHRPAEAEWGRPCHARCPGPSCCGGAVLALGDALFVTSDALLATNKFALPLPLNGLWILATYWAAQWCIAHWLPPRTQIG